MITSLLYLGEQKIEDYHPETNTPGSSSDDKSKAADKGITAFSYEGTEPDGSTKIAAQSATYDDFAAGLVRTKYSQTRSRPSCATMAMAMRSTKRSMTPSRLGASKPRRWLMRCLRERSN